VLQSGLQSVDDYQEYFRRKTDRSFRPGQDKELIDASAVFSRCKRMLPIQSPEHSSDSNHSVIVKESFIKEAGWKLSEAVGKTVNFMNDDNKEPETVIGIIRDDNSLAELAN